ncbi:helix-turn-helix domain-containing protein [Phycicoccus sp.]|uniref:TetR/AcrR family transcriptional regulator n=1 Tax=Phycicoccus sp. TaxID=1902410 RepID=UPI002C47E18E|nr:helix-turn-helix domain-containing protein [Phycicoccus sp.]HMM93796.1 helix-turn-helix domain-containing protein [Phycicoccus sp.]
MRADAVENRKRIVDAARTVLDADEGGGMAAVARLAGVGQGTIYRHFPTWQDLVIEVHRVDLDDLAASGPELLRVHPPMEALRVWLLRLADYGRLKNGLSEAMGTLVHETIGRRSQVADLTAIELLLRAAQEEGSVRADITAEDLFLLVGFLWRIDPAPNREERAERLLDTVLAGIRATAVQSQNG